MMRYWPPVENSQRGFPGRGTAVLTRIGAVVIALGRGAIVRGSNDRFPNQSFEIEDGHVGDHSTFGPTTTALGWG